MLFLNSILLAGAAGILIPIIIHLLNRRSNQVVDWGAMNFLLESLAIRNRRIQLEEALLMATRCLLVGLLVLALARPFIPPGSTIPWIVILPLLLLSVVGIGVTVVLHNEPKWRLWIGVASAALLILCVSLVVFEKYLNLSRFSPGARQDIAIIIDGSTSMMMKTDGLSNFDRAVEEARTIVKRSPRGHAFSIILGGPSPSGKVLDPTTDRGELEAVLDDLKPLDGPMATYHALTLASLSLARGDNPAKQIILFTDEQDVGWEKGKSGRWNFIRDAFQNLPSEPQIILRKMPLPDYTRNLAVTSVTLSRKIVGVDRPVEVSVTVENTGNEAVTPGALVLSVDDGREYRDQSLGQIQPGESQTVNLIHQFGEAGAHALSVTIEVGDDILEDNRGFYALNVADSLRTLIVDGSPASRFFDRASTFAALALAPSSLTLDPTLKPNLPGATDEASDDFDFNYDPTLDPLRFLVEPQVVEAPNLSTIPGFDEFDVIILADVPRLPADSAEAIASFVQRGGGLLVAAGGRVQADFYNNWTGENSASFLPSKLATAVKVSDTRSGETFSPSVRTLTHPALQKIADESAGDFSSTHITTYRPQVVPDELQSTAAVGARLNNGDILLSSRQYGDGRIILLGMSLDSSSGNFVSRQSFLPFLHELVYHLADPAAYDLNLDPGWEVNIGLTGNSAKSRGAGLVGRYYASQSATEPVLTRLDSSVQFNWLNGKPAPDMPGDGFKVEWKGKLRSPGKGNYSFMADVDDQLEIYLDNQKVGEFQNGENRKKAKFHFEENRWYDLRVVYRENGGDARVILSWEGNNLPNQIIGQDYLRAFSENVTSPTASNAILAEYEVVGPDGSSRTAVLSSKGKGSVLSLKGDISSGLYRLKSTPESRMIFQSFLRKGSDEIPFTVKRDPAESHLTRLTEADYAFLEEFVTIAKPQTLEELIGFLNGNQFGQELWKYLAVGAFFFLLAEIALSRWIAHSRRMGEEIEIDFESREKPGAGFREQLVKMGKA